MSGNKYTNEDYKNKTPEHDLLFPTELDREDTVYMEMAAKLATNTLFGKNCSYIEDVLGLPKINTDKKLESQCESRGEEQQASQNCSRYKSNGKKLQAPKNRSKNKSRGKKLQAPQNRSRYKSKGKKLQAPKNRSQNKSSGKHVKARKNCKPNYETLYRDILTDGIDEEDMFYLKSVFKKMKKESEYCVACKFMKLTVSTPKSEDTVCPSLDPLQYLRHSIPSDKNIRRQNIMKLPDIENNPTTAAKLMTSSRRHGMFCGPSTQRCARTDSTLDDYYFYRSNAENLTQPLPKVYSRKRPIESTFSDNISCNGGDKYPHFRVEVFDQRVETVPGPSTIEKVRSEPENPLCDMTFSEFAHSPALKKFARIDSTLNDNNFDRSGAEYLTQPLIKVYSRKKPIESKFSDNKLCNGGDKYPHFRVGVFGERVETVPGPSTIEKVRSEPKNPLCDMTFNEFLHSPSLKKLVPGFDDSTLSADQGHTGQLFVPGYSITKPDIPKYLISEQNFLEKAVSRLTTTVPDESENEYINGQKRIIGSANGRMISESEYDMESPSIRKFEQIISKLENYREHFKRYDPLFDLGVCRLHRLKWVPHPTTADDTDYKVKKPKNPGEVEAFFSTTCARTTPYEKKAILELKKKRVRRVKDTDFSPVQKKPAWDKAYLYDYSLNPIITRLSKINTTDNKVEPEENVNPTNPTLEPYDDRSYNGEKLTVTKDMWNDQRRHANFCKDDGSYLFTFNHLKFLKSKLRIAKSTIQGLGVYATEQINTHEIIIEYVGEVIRPIIADLREKTYKQTFTFCIDDQTVVDATKCGNISRYINHSCCPNSYGKLLVYNNQKKIVIYAKKRIFPGQEITYDYQMEPHDDKIVCLCKSRRCRKSIN